MHPRSPGHGRATATATATAAATALLVLALLLVLPGTAAAQPTAVHLRADAAGTSPLLSAYVFDAAEEVLIGTAADFPDNLAAGVLQDTRPLLLTQPDALSPAVADEIARLGAVRAAVLGGESAVAPAVVDQLEAMGVEVRRLAGPTRTETAVAVAASTGATDVLLARAQPDPGTSDPSQAFADSLTAGAWAAATGMPVLLTQTDVLTASTAAHLVDAGVQSVTIVGGTAAVSDAVRTAVQDLGIATERVAGPTRVDTAIAVAAARGLDDPAALTRIVLTEGQSGDAWIAGFSAAALAAAGGAPVLLADGPALPAPTAGAIQAVADEGAPVELVCTPSVDPVACGQAADLLGAAVVEVTADSVGAPADHTDAPDLVAAELVGGDATSTLLRLTYDEPVSPIDQSRLFATSPWFTLAEIPASLGLAADAGDPASVLLEVAAGADQRSRLVTAYSAAGAVQDADGLLSTPGTAAIADVTLTGDRTDGPDLIAVSGFDSGPGQGGDGVETVDFTFDEPVALGADPTHFVLIPASDPASAWASTAAAVVDDTTIRATFGGAGQLSDAQWADVARALVFEQAVVDADGLAALPITVDVNQPGTGTPDLVAVELSLPDRQAVFRFDEVIGQVLPNHRFYLYDVRGGLYGPAFVLDAVQTGPQEVTVTYGGGAVHEGIVGARILNPVEDLTGDQAKRDSVPVEASWPGGYTSGPDATAIERQPLMSGGNPVGIELVVTFDEPVTRMAGDPVPTAYAADGTAVELPVTACEAGPDPEQITCAVLDANPTAPAIAGAAAIGLPGGTATGLEGATLGSAPATLPVG